MRNHEIVMWGITGALALTVLAAILVRVSASRRLRRRLRKTHGRIVSKSRQPTVKFSVNPPKD